MVLDSQGTQDADGGKGSSGKAPHSKPDADRANPVPGRPASGELDARQIQAISLYIANPNKAAVAAEIGVSAKTLTRWFQNQEFIDEYLRQLGEVQVELWAQMVATKNEAWERFKNLMAETDPRISLRATTWFLDRFLSSPSFLSRLAARDSGIGADLALRERELLSLVGALGRGDVDRSSADASSDDDDSDDVPEANEGDDANEVTP